MYKIKQRFLEKMHPYGFYEKDLGDAYDHMMRLRTDFYNLNQSQLFEKGVMMYYLTLHRTEKQPPYLRSYKATLRYVPPIHHAVYNGVNSGKLEQRLSAFRNEHSSGSFDALKDEVADIWKQMERFRMTGAENAINILQQLQVKYFQGTIAEQFVHLDLKTIRYDRTFEFRTNGPHHDINAEHAYNLLSGRSVKRPAIGEEADGSPHWLILKRPVIPDPYCSFVEERLADFDLGESLNEIIPVQPMGDDEKIRIAEDLSNGNIVPVRDQRTERTIYLQADPEQREIQIVNNPPHTLIRAVENRGYHKIKTRGGQRP